MNERDRVTDDDTVVPLSGRPFGALVVAASSDPIAACALAGAYARMPVEARVRLIAAVVTDANGEGVDPLAALAALLAVEEDSVVAATIRDALVPRASRGDVAGPGRPTALAWGSHDGAGAAVLVRPLYGPFVDVLGLCWDASDSVVRTLIEPLARADALDRVLDGLPSGSLEPAPFSVTRDRVVDLLWRHLRAGGTRLPPTIAAFL